MSFKATKCANCKKDIQVPDDIQNAKCMYCGSNIVVKEALKASSGGYISDNYMMLAKKAEAGNSAESNKYYTAVLEHDHKNIDAWIGKGVTGSLGIETSDINSLRTAIELSINKNETKNKIIERLSNKYSILIDEKKSVINSNFQSWDHDFSGEIGKLMHEIDPDNIFSMLSEAYNASDYEHKFMTYEKILNKVNNTDRLSIIIKSMLNWEMYFHTGKSQEYADNVAWCLICLTKLLWFSSEESLLKEVINEVIETISIGTVQVCDPSILSDLKDSLDNLKKNKGYLFSPFLVSAYQQLFPAPEKEEGCFIATATYGSPMAHEVILLREYRDTRLKGTQVGKAFVKIYYCISPPISRLIINSNLLRALTRQILNPIIVIIKGLK